MTLPTIPDTTITSIASALAGLQLDPPDFSDDQVLDLLGLQRTEVQSDPYLDGKPEIIDGDDYLVAQTLDGPIVAVWVPSYRRWLILTLEASERYRAFPIETAADRKSRANAIQLFDDIQQVHRDRQSAECALRALPGANKTRRELIDEAATEFAIRGAKYFSVGLGLKRYLDRREELERESEAMMDAYPG